jgi:virginiamycin B lyase
MFVPPSISEPVIRLGLASLFRPWVRPHRRPPDRNRARFRLEGLEDRCLLSGISAMSNFAISTLGTGADWGITKGSDGNLWFTSSSDIGMINLTTDAISEFPTPTANSGTRGITSGPDGNLWFTENGANKIGMINPTTHAITEFALKPSNSGPQDITAGPDGNLWFTQNSANRIGMISPTTHAVSEFSVPTSNSGPFGITAGPDGNLWFTEYSGNKVGVINPTTHAITEFPIPNADELQEIAEGPDGNLWFSQFSTIGDISPATHVITQFATSVGPFGITAGPDGNVWFTEAGGKNIARINPTTGALTEYPVEDQYPTARPRGITVGPDGNLWFTQNRVTASIGVATLSSSELVVTQQPPASVAAGSPFGLTVQAEDSTGNLITTFNGTVTVGLGNDTNYGGTPTLGGTLTVTASDGVATFSGLTLSPAGYYYSLYTSGGGFGWGVTNTITVTSAAAPQSAITQQPPATATVTASQGIATLSGLTINKVGSGYTLQVTSGVLSSAVTNPINVTKTGNSPSPLSAPTATVTPDPLLGPLVLDSPDLWDGLPLKKRIRTI